MKKSFNKIMANISNITELPLNEICREFTAGISGRREITVDGVRSIIKYETEEIVLDVCGEYILVFGKGLQLKSFFKMSLCISGELDKIEFAERVGEK